MEGKDQSSMENLKFTAVETVKVVTIVVFIVLWSFHNFLTKDEADRRAKVRDDQNALLAQQIRDVTSRQDGFEKTLTGVAVDVSYIRGRFEPRGK